ncbi:MAG: tetratricopeptide repeat protein [Bryobacteraceae bacterium]
MSGSNGTQSGRYVRFAEFEIDRELKSLTRGGLRIKLQPQPWSVLDLLLRTSPSLVSRAEIRKHVWGDDRFVDFEQSLNFCVRQIRAALSDAADAPKFIETVPRLGYRFIGTVTAPDTEPQAEKATDPPARQAVAAIEVTAVAVPPAESASPPAPAVGALSRRRYAWALFAVILLIVPGAYFLRTRNAPPQPIRVAVFPFENLGAPEDEFFGKGISEELVSRLAEVRGLEVISHRATAELRARSKSAREAAIALNATYVLEGSVRIVAGQARVTTQLSELAPGRVVWSESFDRPLAGTLHLQDEIATAAATALVHRIPETKTPATRSAAAQREYLLGRYLLGRSGNPESDGALSHFEEAARLDPNYAAAWAGIGDAWVRRGISGLVHIRVGSDRGVEYARRALSIDNELAEGHRALANALFVGRHWAEAEQEFRKALLRSPEDPELLTDYAVLLLTLGREEESLATIRRASSAAPTLLGVLRYEAMLLGRARRYDEALTKCRKVLDLDPNFRMAYLTLGSTLLEIGRYREAQEAYFRFLEGSTSWLSARAYVTARSGDLAEARALEMEASAKEHEKGRQPDINDVLALYLLGDRKAALDGFERLALDRWAIDTAWIKVDPRYDPMRKEPRFQEIQRKMGL